MKRPGSCYEGGLKTAESDTRINALCAAGSSSTEHELKAVETESIEPKRRRVAFDEAVLMYHEPALSGDRLPQGGPGVGLGKLCHVQVRRVDSYDSMREASRTGVRRIGAEERRATLVPITRSVSLEHVEREADIVRRQREESNRELEPDGEDICKEHDRAALTHLGQESSRRDVAMPGSLTHLGLGDACASGLSDLFG